MKKIILVLILFAGYVSGIAQINVSTSTNAGVYVTPPNPDPAWVVSGPNSATPVPAYAVPSYGSFWQATPIAGTNAGWISPTPNQGQDIPGIYTFERSFTIDPCVASFACNFRLSWDDVLVGSQIFLVPPPGFGSPIPITVTPTNPSYQLSNPVTNVINAPAAGTWKIRAKVRYIDALGGFILSGYINTTSKPCCCTFTNKVKIGSATGNLKCGDILSLNCNTTAAFTPFLSNCTNPNAHINSVTLTGTSGTPSWATNFLSNNGYGNLVIPAGVSGTYTLKYIWGPECIKCDSCSITLKITCCSGFSVNAGPDLTSCCDPLQFNAITSGGTGPYTYLWSPGTGLSSTTIANPICSTSGTYIVTVTDSSGCVKKDTIKAFFQTGSGSCCKQAQNTATQQSSITAKAQVTNIKAIPNPFMNGFTIQGLESNAVSVNIYTASGKLINQYKNIERDQTYGKGLSAGVYIIKVDYKDGSQKTIKAIKSE